MSNKTILLKIDSPLALEYYKKKINDIEVLVRREAFDDWSEVELTIPSTVTLPESGSDYFSTKELGIDVNIIDVSEDTSVQYTILTDIDDDLRDMINEEYGSNDSFNDDWELYKTDYQIDFYTVKGQ